jgi:hypothetical protein
VALPGTQVIVLRAIEARINKRLHQEIITG